MAEPDFYEKTLNNSFMVLGRLSLSFNEDLNEDVGAARTMRYGEEIFRHKVKQAQERGHALELQKWGADDATTNPGY